MKFISTLFFVAISLFGICLGGKMDGSSNQIDVSEVERFKPTIEDFIKKNQADNDWIYLDTFKNATSQLVAGTLYNIDFIAVRTNCHKNDSANSKDKCETKEVQKNCKVSIWEKPWLNFTEVQKMDCMSVKFQK